MGSRYSEVSCQMAPPLQRTFATSPNRCGRLSHCKPQALAFCLGELAWSGLRDRIRGTLGEIDPLNEVPFKRAVGGVLSDTETVLSFLPVQHLQNTNNLGAFIVRLRFGGSIILTPGT